MRGEDVVHDAPSKHGGCFWVFRLHPICTDSLVEDVMHPDRADHCLLKCEPLPPLRITGQFDRKKIRLEGPVQDMRDILSLAGTMMCQEGITVLSHRDKAKGLCKRYGRDTDGKMFFI